MGKPGGICIFSSTGFWVLFHRKKCFVLFFFKTKQNRKTGKKVKHSNKPHFFTLLNCLFCCRHIIYAAINWFMPSFLKEKDKEKKCCASVPPLSFSSLITRVRPWESTNEGHLVTGSFLVWVMPWKIKSDMAGGLCGTFYMWQNKCAFKTDPLEWYMFDKW